MAKIYSDLMYMLTQSQFVADFFISIEQNNFKLMKSFFKSDAPYKLSQDDVCRALNMTTSLHIAEWLVKNQNPNQQSIETLLIEATQKSHNQLLNLILKITGVNQPSYPVIEKAFKVAIKTLNLTTIMIFFCDDKPVRLHKESIFKTLNTVSRKNIKLLLNKAIKERKSEMVTPLLSLQGNNKIAYEEVEAALFTAVTSSSLKIVKLFFNRKAFAIRQDTVSKALNQSSSWDVAEWLCKYQKPCQDSVEILLIEAAYKRQTKLVGFILTTRKLSDTALKRALFKAVTSGSLNTVIKFFNNKSFQWSQATISEALNTTSNWAIAKWLCEFQNPDKQSVQFLLFEALGKKQYDLARFILCLNGAKELPYSMVEQALFALVATSDLDMVKVFFNAYKFNQDTVSAALLRTTSWGIAEWLYTHQNPDQQSIEDWKEKIPLSPGSMRSLQLDNETNRTTTTAQAIMNLGSLVYSGKVKAVAMTDKLETRTSLNYS